MRAAKATKQRDLEGGKVAAFTLETVQLAEDLDGDPITSCIVEPQDAAELKRSKSRMLTGLNQVAHQALHDALRDKGAKVSNSEHYPLGRKRSRSICTSGGKFGDPFCRRCKTKLMI